VPSADGGQGTYTDGAYVVHAPAGQVATQLAAHNAGAIDLDEPTLVLWIEDPRDTILFKVAGEAFLGGDGFEQVRAPAMLDDRLPVFPLDPYAGWVAYIPIGALPAGATESVDVIAGAASGLVMHFEAVATLDADREEFAVPMPSAGTTLVVD
jgi:hypothetical protein